MEETALQLWKEWFEKVGDPLEADGDCDLCCFFCGGWAVSRDDQEHEDDCIYIRAKKWLERLSAQQEAEAETGTRAV